MFKSKSEIKSEIPTASMPDIIFMLLVFFMVTTVLRTYEGLPLTLPSATKIEKLESRRDTAHIFVSKAGMVSIDDKIIPIPSIRNVIYAKLVENPKLTISLKADRDTPRRLVAQVETECRYANALKVNYSAKTRAG